MRARPWVGLLVVAVATAACDPEIIVYDQLADRREVGAPCIIDGECASGRCQDKVCVDPGCDSDEDCPDGEICNPLTHTCESISNYACALGQAPLLQLEVSSYTFGTVVVGETAEASIEVGNIGDCLLTLDQAQLAAGSDSAFACLNCDVDSWPKHVPPGHVADVHLSFTPQQERAYSGTLSLRSDDTSLADGVARVELSGDGLGHPRMALEPALIDFGHVATDATAVTRLVTVTNIGAGTLEISRAFVHPPALSSAMSVEPELGALDQPIALVANQSHQFTVTFDPVDLAPSEAYLYLFSNDLERTCAADDTDTPGVGCVELRGDSRGPPAIQVSHTEIDFGDKVLGETGAEMITVTNAGTSDLTLAISMTRLSSSDFRYTPPSQAVLPAGAQAFFNVIYEATQLGEVRANLQIESNDPTSRITGLGLRGFGLSPYNNDVLKVEMVFENGDNGFFGNDYRNVDLYLESPFGEIVDKQHPTPDWSHGGGNDQQNFGHPQWNAIGVNEEPERVILFDAHEDALGVFKACVTYVEDCANIPSDLLAGLLGIGLSALLAGLTEGILAPDAGDMAEFIRNNCWDHASSTAKLTTYVNGAIVAEHSVTLGGIGDSACPVDIQRINGLYCVSGAPNPPPGCR